MTVRKRFDRSLFLECDQKARKATIAHLENSGHVVEHNPDKYAQDLIAKKNEFTFYAECEMKLIWQGKTFPYPTVHLPERKKKFFDSPTKFYIWNADTSYGVSFWSHDIQTIEPVEVPNKYVYKGEMFFPVPLSCVEEVEL